MASIQHQFIIDCIIRKMRYLAFEPICFDGKSIVVDSLKIPPKVIRHRPDIIGVNKYNELCIGEAKTANDIHSKRTKEQIIDYNKAGFLTVIACPKSCFLELSSLISKTIPKSGMISILKIPDELIPNDEI